MKLTKACARFLRKHGGTVLAVGASVGVVATAIETGRATTKAKHLLEVDEALRVKSLIPLNRMLAFAAELKLRTQSKML